MKRIIADKIGSATKNVPLKHEVWIDPVLQATEGYLIAGRIHGENSVYNKLENHAGRLIHINNNDIIVGVLGSRNALHGYSGTVPKEIKLGDRLHLLNMGGVIGHCSSYNPDVGKPYEVEVLGAPLVFPYFEERRGERAHIGMNALAAQNLGEVNKVPLIVIAGTCMNSGKTCAANNIVRSLASHGFKVAACKLTGVGLLRDTLAMEDHGALWSHSFLDTGIPSTTAESAVSSTYTILAQLISYGPDVIVAELGDGILGEYGVQQILSDIEIRSRIHSLVVCASDPVGAWGAVSLLKSQYELSPQVISGPVTDNAVGVRYIEQHLKVSAINARSQREELGQFIVKQLQAESNER